MSLTAKQEDDTRAELKANFEKANVSVMQIAQDLGTSADYISELFRLNPRKLEDTWILKNYLIEKIREAGKEPTPFTALGGSYRAHWFLNSEYIEGKKIY